MIKPVSDTTQRDAFIAEARAKENPKQLSLFDIPNLKKLSNDELVSRVEQVDDQALINKWLCLWELRTRFKSDKLFGQYLAELQADPTRSICWGKNIGRIINAGKFCEKHKITNLEKVGILQSSIYALSQPINADVADQVFRQIKNKNIPNKEVERLIAQAKAVATIEFTPEPKPVEVMEYDKPHEKITIPVINNVAQIDLPPEPTVTIDVIPTDYQPLAVVQSIAEQSAVVAHTWDHDEVFDGEYREDAPINPLISLSPLEMRLEAIKALPRVKKASDDEIINHGLIFFSQYEDRSEFALGKLAIELSKRFMAMQYGKG
jgi:hypothetical protein